MNHPVRTKNQVRRSDSLGQSRSATAHPRTLQAVGKGPNRWTTESGFRLIRGLPADANAARLRHHVKRLERFDRQTLDGRRFCLRLHRLQRNRT